jgi:hypothetical protein
MNGKPIRVCGLSSADDLSDQKTNRLRWRVTKMANFSDLRQAGSDETKVKLEVYLDKDGSVVIHMNDCLDEEIDPPPQMFLTLTLFEAKRLRGQLLETINQGVAALGEEIKSQSVETC